MQSIVETINSLARGATCPPSSTETTIVTAYDDRGNELTHYVIADSASGIAVSNGNGVVSERYVSERAALNDGFFSNAVTFRRWHKQSDGQFLPV